MKAPFITSVMILACCSSLPAAHPQPEEGASSYFSYARLGTQGLGLGAGSTFRENLTLRLGFNRGSTYSGSRRIDDNRYDVSRTSDASVEALLDWYPRPASGLRLSGGLMLTDTRTRLTARANDGGNYVLNGNSYSAEELGSLTGSVRPASLSPYLGVGWESGRPGRPGLRFVADAGVFHLKSRRASLLVSADSLSGDVQHDLRAEEGRIKAVNDFGINASIGLSYSF